MFEMTAPCETCPFLRDSAVRLLPGRALAIATNMLRPEGGPFFCHRTIAYDDAAGYGTLTPESQHCAGALLFAAKRGRETMIMRQARRLGWDPSGLRGHERVFDSVEELLAVATAEPAELW
jgi:hypothetical protein